MKFEVCRVVLAIAALSGCAGVYGEVALTKISSTSVEPDGGGMTTSGGGATQIGFNAGIEFGNYKKRLAGGYSKSSFSSDAGDSTFTGSDIRYDHGVYNPIDRLSMRLGLGLGGGTNKFKDAMGADKTSGAYALYAGVAAAYFATWRTPIHAFIGYERAANSIAAGTSSGGGFTIRIGASAYVSDVRPDLSYVEALDSATDITPAIEAGASAIGCATTSKSRQDTYARLEVACPGGKHIEFFQIAEGIMVTCRKEVSESRCKNTAKQIANAAVSEMKGGSSSSTTTSTPTPPTPPATPPTTPPAEPAAPPPAPDASGAGSGSPPPPPPAAPPAATP